jgi:hypothetical protein
MAARRSRVTRPSQSQPVGAVCRLAVCQGPLAAHADPFIYQSSFAPLTVPPDAKYPPQHKGYLAASRRAVAIEMQALRSEMPSL